jgi:KipI family sensor histidine kinase inhibitor
MGYPQPRLLPAGDSALLVELGDEIDLDVNLQVHALAQALNENPLPGQGEAVPTYRSLLLHYDPLHLSLADVTALVEETLSNVKAQPQPEPRIVEIPTCYSGKFGPDLEFVARHNDLRPEDVIRLHTSTLYPVYMLGFSPGYAYMGGVPQAMATPRLSTPRTLVPVGSVAVAGTQTGIYSLTTPGGWRLIGRTPLRLFDPRRDPPTLLRPGDRVRFVPIDPDRYTALWEQEWEADAKTPAAKPAPGSPGLEVLQPGLLTTVQDLGRRGYERFGVPVAGAMSPFDLRAANALVGNPLNAAALEITTAGPALQATADCLIAVGGGDLGLRVNGRPLPPWMSAYVRKGWRIEFSGRQTGCRAYLAVAGGFVVPPVMDSVATYLRGEFGGLDGRRIQAGDFLPVAPVEWHLAARAGRRLPASLIPNYSSQPTVDVILGPQAEAFTESGLKIFLSNEYQVSATADRMGYRLQGPAIDHQDSADIISDGVPWGAVQVPADRQPIVMMADRQTTGGYPKIATVASVDIPLLAQCLPGESSVRFRATTVEAAQQRYREMREALDRLSV